MKNKETSLQYDQREHSLVRKDFLFVVILNAILLGIMLGLYFWNRSTGQLDQFFGRFINF
ncbi:MAG TPA: hypothetical protein VEC17_03815 [Candidatus Binatia bacterium]|nr:hypothetical protein [Candidatus Binatia bacterium]